MSQTYNVVSPLDAALSPPPSITPDFEDPFSLRPYWNVTASLSLVTTSIILILRMYTKIMVVKKCRWEDHMSVLGFAFFAAWIALTFEALDAGAGVHQWNLSERDLAHQYKFYNYSDIIFSPGICFKKLSITFLVLRVFCPLNRDPFHWVLQSLNIANVIFYVIFFFVPIFACHPRQKIWLQMTPGRCLQLFDLYIASAAFNAVSDIAMYSAPLWKIWHLQMPKSRKLGISAIFAMGSLAIISAIARLVYMIFLLHHADYSYIKMQGTIFALSEISTGIICSCLFVVPRLYRHLTTSPPYDSEEYRLRKYKNLTGRRHLDDDPYSQKVHHREEQRNPWEHDIEVATLPPKPTSHY